MKLSKATFVSAMALFAFSAFSQNNITAVDLAYGAIEVTGESRVSLPADYAEIQISMNSQAADAKVAHRLTTEQMARAIEFLKNRKDVSDQKTTRVSLTPTRTGQRSENVEYYATQSLTFRLNEVRSYDELMLSLIGMGITGINQVTFKSSSAEKYEDKLLQMAMVDARRKAVLMATEYGQEVGRAIHISDRVDTGSPRPVMAYKSASFDMAGPSVEAGEIELSTSVSVQFELKSK